MERHEITSENKEEELKRWQFTESAFGPNPQPVLERVEFKVRFTQQSVLAIHAKCHPRDYLPLHIKGYSP